MTQSASAASRDEVVFFLNDALGSAIAAVNENGDLCWSERYTPYGDKLINDDTVQIQSGCGLLGEERGFTGHTEDYSTDLVYMQQRYYDPSMGRLLSVDPVGPIPGDSRTFNRYAYGANNPYTYVDRTGEIFETRVNRLLNAMTTPQLVCAEGSSIDTLISLWLKRKKHQEDTPDRERNRCCPAPLASTPNPQ